MRTLCLSLLMLTLAQGCSNRSEAPDAGDGAMADSATTSDAATDGATADAATDGATADAAADSATADAATDGATADAATDGAAADSATADAATADAAADSATADGGMPAAGVTYLVRRDIRRCPYPDCGGFWLAAANQTDTLCADGSRAAECYIVDFDWSALGLTAATTSEAEGASGGLLAEGQLMLADFGARHLGRLTASAGWSARWGTALTSGAVPPFYVVGDNGLRCLMAPCFNQDLTLINVGTMSTASGLDLSMAGASRAEQTAGISAASGGVLRVAGQVADDAAPGPGGLGRTLTATQFYLPMAR